jgi:hypothetical protein
MSLLRSIFGPSKDEIWSSIAKDIGGKYIDGGFWKKDVLRYRHRDWEILLDTYTQSSGSGSNHSSTTYTRMRAPFVNKDGLYFKIYRKGIFSSIGRFFGMQDLEIGDSFFDGNFIIKGNNPKQIKRLLNNEPIKDLIRQQRRIHFEIRDDEGWFGNSFPEGVDELYFQCVGVIKETDQLKALFELFSSTLTRLVQIDSAYENDPTISLK